MAPPVRQAEPGFSYDDLPEYAMGNPPGPDDPTTEPTEPEAAMGNPPKIKRERIQYKRAVLKPELRLRAYAFEEMQALKAKGWRQTLPVPEEVRERMHRRKVDLGLAEPGSSWW